MNQKTQVVRLLFIFQLLICCLPCYSQDYSLSDTADPAIIQVGSEKYVFSTGKDIHIRRSYDLVHWQKIGSVFPEGIPSWVHARFPKFHGIWAPDITSYKGIYRLYYAVSVLYTQDSCIGLAENKTLDPESPDYEWVDKGMVIESTVGGCDYNAIDPAFFVDKDGKPWLGFGSFWTGIKLFELAPTTGKPYSLKPKMYSLAERKAEKAIEAPLSSESVAIFVYTKI